MSCVLVASAAIGLRKPRAFMPGERRPSIIAKLVLALAGGGFVEWNIWVLNDDVWRETRLFNRGLFLGAAVVLGMCGALGVGFWPSVGTTLFVGVAPLVHAFLAHRRIVPAPGRSERVPSVLV